MNSSTCRRQAMKCFHFLDVNDATASVTVFSKLRVSIVKQKCLLVYRKIYVN
jgi:hypothetical protein